ncbi:MAG: DMT family transporter [Candidatus Heimdallarchaeota archaeon]|nr:MAG: DMT family transporter [Candidatus Heimdallarchaeota archaeon]
MDPKKKNEVLIGPAVVAVANASRAFDAPVRYPLILKNFTLDVTNPLVSSRSAFIVLIEHIIGTIIATILLFSRQAQNRLYQQLQSFDRREWLSFVLVSLGSGLGLYFFMLALAYGNPTIAILLQKSQPLITLAFAMVIMHERPTRFYYLALLASLVGIYFMVFETFGQESSNELMAALFSLIAAGFWGSNTVWGRILTDKVDYWNLTTLRYIGGTIILVGFNLIVGAYTSKNFNILNETINTFWVPWPRDLLPLDFQIQMNGLISIILVTIFTGGIIPLALYYFGLRWSRASVGGLAELAFPFLAIFINFIFLGFELTGWQILGAIILLTVVSIMSYVNRKEYEKEKSPE